MCVPLTSCGKATAISTVATVDCEEPLACQHLHRHPQIADADLVDRDAAIVALALDVFEGGERQRVHERAPL